MTENILTVGQCLSPYTCKCCIVFKQFDGLNFDGVYIAGKCQNSPVKVLRFTVVENEIISYNAAFDQEHG